MDKELYNLFKYAQGICHVWDTHEIGLLKKERSLQELLQDCRKNHDTDNQVIDCFNYKRIINWLNILLNFRRGEKRN